MMRWKILDAFSSRAALCMSLKIRVDCFQRTSSSSLVSFEFEFQLSSHGMKGLEGNKNAIIRHSSLQRTFLKIAMKWVSLVWVHSWKSVALGEKNTRSCTQKICLRSDFLEDEKRDGVCVRVFVLHFVCEALSRAACLEALSVWLEIMHGGVLAKAHKARNGMKESKERV